MDKIEIIKEAFKGKIREHTNLKDYSFLHTGGYAGYLFLPASIKDLKLIREELGIIDVIGNGSNVLFKGNVNQIMVLSGLFDSSIIVNGERIVVGAGAGLPNVARVAYENSLSGLEELVGIPGTIGGAIKMNAGAYGRTIFDILDEFTIFDMNSGEIKIIDASKVEVKYRDGNLKRGEIALKAVLQLKRRKSRDILTKMTNFSKNRRIKQPVKGYSLGSIFKNPKKYPAGWLIEECGLKGKRIGGAFISEKHANFIINDGNATSSDILKLIDITRDMVLERFNIELELEIVIL